MPDKVQRSYHPMDLSESDLERLIKLAAQKRGAIIDEDNPYLEQYLHPNRDILPKQTLRPSINPSGQPDTMVYRKPAITIKEVADPNDTNWEEINTALKAGKKVDYSKYPQTQYNTRDLNGLGSFKRGQTPNYDSIYDIWDFDTNHPLANSNVYNNDRAILPRLEDWASKTFMQHVGQPYAVYDRFPKDTMYSEVDVPGDIELPKETGLGPSGQMLKKKYDY